MRYSWNPSGGPPPPTPQIGAALHDAGCITEQQLQETVERQQRTPYFTFGQLVSLMHRVPMAKVDAVCVQVMVLPLVGPVVMEHLVRFAGKDRFAKSLDPERFIQEMHLEMLHYEVMHIDARKYSNKGEEIQKQGIKRYVLIQGLVNVQLHTLHGGVQGQVHVRHDSASQCLELADDQDQIKTALYYGLRMAYTRTGADAVS